MSDAVLQEFVRGRIKVDAVKMNDIAAVIFYDLRFDAVGAKVSDNIHMRYESYGRNILFVSVRRKRPVNISRFIHFSILHTKTPEFIYKILRELKLLLRAWPWLSIGVTHSIATSTFAYPLS